MMKSRQEAGRDRLTQIKSRRKIGRPFSDHAAQNPETLSPKPPMPPLFSEESALVELKPFRGLWSQGVPVWYSGGLGLGLTVVCKWGLKGLGFRV